ncbi:MAG TPA: replication endonuclease [Aromatoleum sp.]|uniref:replication endonuclease n=1 Tax=Aromatoleum sp. TaxID=2307007 RepID=UPI002B47F6E1|nr:replication endonuclease [Aromatoleum sp.]HJV24573.1 replication endonuclease [Aromatoleum sp.]
MKVRLSHSDLERIGRNQAAALETWGATLAGHMPAPWRHQVLSDWKSRRAADERDGNTWLRHLVEEMQEGCAVGLGLDASDEDIREAGKQLAARAFQVAEDLHIKTLPALRERLASLCEQNGVQAPECRIKDKGAVRRMTTAAWWVRKLRAAHGQRIEAAAISLGYVHKRGQRYASDVGVKRRREQKARNAASLAATIAVNQDGQEFTLAELAEKSNANPRVRRAELMTRIRGFEMVADSLGHVAEFLTMTAPSRFHAIKVDGLRNPKYDGTKPADTQKQLVKRWARARAAMARDEIRLYGFRICEPHHDGCPHWHMLAFLPADKVERVREIVRHYFLETWDGHEAGAAENRVKFEAIDKARGGAVAYVSKYISKNIDGMTVNGDLLGDGQVEVAERVETWATTWRIRQFQQLGGAPVGVWRELRRLKVEDGLSDTVEQGRIMADVGRNSDYGQSAPGWAGYVALQGGPLVSRADLAMRVERTEAGEKMDPTTGECVEAVNCYEEPCAPNVWGVRDAEAGRVFLSRRFKWEVRRGSGNSGQVQGGAPVVVRGGDGSRVSELGSDGVRAGASGNRGGGLRGSGFAPARAPRTRVNNCTRSKQDGSDETGSSGRGSGRDEGGTGIRRYADAQKGHGGGGIRGAGRGDSGGACGNSGDL